MGDFFGGLGATLGGLGEGMQKGTQIMQGVQQLQLGKEQMDQAAMQTRKAKEEETQRNQMISVDTIMNHPGVADHPETMKLLKNIASPYIKQGAGGKDMIRAGDMQAIQQQLSSNQNMQKQLMQTSAMEDYNLGTAYGKKRQETEDELKELQEKIKADPTLRTDEKTIKKLNKLQADIKENTGKEKKYMGSHAQISQMLISMDAKAQEEAAKEAAKASAAPFKASSGRIYDIRTGEVISEKSGEHKPLSDIGKLYSDRIELGKQYGEDAPVVKSIDAEIKKKAGEAGIKPPGSLAEFEAYYQNKGGKLEDIVGTPRYETEWQNFLKSKATPAASVRLEFATPTAAATEKGRQSAQPQLSDDALAIEGAKYATTGVMPPLGMNNPVMRTKIVNAGAKYLKDQGVSPSDVPALQGEFKGAKDAYISMKKATENFGAFEKAMLKNMDYAVNLSSKFGRTQFPAANAVLNAIRTGTGNAQVVEFGNAVYAAAMEFEKIRTSGTNVSSAELSITAQKKAEDVLNKAQNHEQLKAAMKAMKTDASNVIGSRRSALSEMDAEMKRFGGNMGQTTGERGNAPKVNQKQAVSYLKQATDRESAKKRIKSLLDKGWSAEDMKSIAKEAGWE